MTKPIDHTHPSCRYHEIVLDIYVQNIAFWDPSFYDLWLSHLVELSWIGLGLIGDLIVDISMPNENWHL